MRVPRRQKRSWMRGHVTRQQRSRRQDGEQSNRKARISTSHVRHLVRRVEDCQGEASVV
jgi:hypothetical protein